MKTIHIVTAILSLLAGAIALFATKGSTWHRRAGLAFSVAMIVMTASAFIAAALLRPNLGNTTAALFTFYLVATGTLTVRTLPHARALLVASTTLGASATATALALGYDLLGRNVLPDGIPAFPMFLFGGIGVLAIAGDARLLAGTVLAGPERLSRHLWRMTFAMWIATTSAFLGQAKFLPLWFKQFGLHIVPALAVLAMLVYWMVKMRRARRRSPARFAETATA